MTTKPTTSTSGSWLTGTRSSTPTRTEAPVVYELIVARPIPLPNTVSLETLTRRHEGDPEKARYLAEARKRLAQTLYSGEIDSLSALRLNAGLSQVQLAKLVDTSQSYIARIERGQHDPGTDMVARIAQALSVQENRVYFAIRRQRATRVAST